MRGLEDTGSLEMGPLSIQRQRGTGLGFRVGY